MLFYGVTMLQGGVALIFYEIIVGILLVKFSHHRIPCYFGNNGGSGDGSRAGFAFNKRLLRCDHRNGEFTINQKKLWAGTFFLELKHSSFHGQKRCLKNVYFIHGRVGDNTNTNTCINGV